MFSSCFRQCTGSVREEQAVLQPSHGHHPRASLEAEEQEKAHRAGKGWPAKAGAEQHGNKRHVHCEGSVPFKPAQKLQSYFPNFLHVCQGPFEAVPHTQAHICCVWPMNQHWHVLGLLDFLFPDRWKIPHKHLSAVVPVYFPYWIQLQISYLTGNRGATRVVYKDR